MIRMFIMFARLYLFHFLFTWTTAKQAENANSITYSRHISRKQETEITLELPTENEEQHDGSIDLGGSWASLSKINRESDDGKMSTLNCVPFHSFACWSMPNLKLIFRLRSIFNNKICTSMNRLKKKRILHMKWTYNHASEPVLLLINSYCAYDQ